ncbi:LamG-like jellyroll fold domain-containing protein [uncultured Polaribacter sp.]|uniref:LamG-like jellyroll fold domain-containing protein n=1 Tax=uncultured Polaribacter sp. TaxID=174711 RepID=UPI00259AF731|nr:LamG-like jellyroll fold domain-containing protein [uncultured Polaribacter sp.]
MKFIKRILSILILLVSQLVVAQIPCSSGFNANGTNDYITIPNTDAINLQNTRNRTVEFWFKPDDINTRQVLYEEGAQVNVIMFFIENGRVYAGAYRNNATSNANRRFFRSAIGDIEVGKWSHIALTLTDSPSLTLKWFLDGVEKDSQNGLQVNTHSGDIAIGRNGGNIRFPSSLTNNWTSSSIGSSTSQTYNSGFTGQTNTDYNFDGNISLLRIWNVARTQTQIDTNKSTLLTTGTSLVAYQEGDQMRYEANNTSTIGGTATATGSGTTYTWSGTTSTDFGNNANWVGNAPDVTKTQTVTINNGSNNPSITSEINIGRLTVDAGAEVIVQNGATLNVFYELTNNGKITVEDGGALIYHACDAAIAGSGTFDIKRVTPTYNSQYFYSYWSSPIVEANASPSTIFSDAPVIYSFAASSEDSDWAYNGAANFKPGVGYAIRSENNGGQLRTFSGKINEGDVKVNVFYSSNFESEDPNNVWSTAGDNLVGNPYASAIDWDLVIADTDNSNIEGTIYFWNQNTVETGDNNVSDYLQYNSTGGASPGVTGKIGTGQGFFVRTTANSTITFKTTHQIAANNNQFFKGVSKNTTPKKEGRSWFTFNRGDKTNTLLVGFLEGATNRYDRTFDAPFDINQKSLGFYSVVRDGKKASIQGLPKLRRAKKVVKIGYVVDQVGEYSIGIQEEHIDEDYYIYLRDTEKKITTDLRKRKYIFNIDSIGENNTRFKLVYTKKRRKASNLKSTGKQSVFVEEVDSKDFTVYVDGAKELIVEYDFDVDNVKEVSLYNIQGRKVATFSGQQAKNISNLKSGIYIVNAILIDNRVLNKKMVISN